MPERIGNHVPAFRDSGPRSTATVLSLDGRWILPVTDVIEYRPNGWAYVRTPLGRFYADPAEITVYPQAM